MAVIIFVAIFCAYKWLKWKVATLSLVYYLAKNQYKQPSDDDLKEGAGFAVRSMIKDLALSRDHWPTKLKI